MTHTRLMHFIPARLTIIALVAAALIAGIVATSHARTSEAAGRNTQIGVTFLVNEYYSLHQSPVTDIVISGRNQYGAWATWRYHGFTSSAVTSGWWWADGWIQIQARCANTGAWGTRWVYKDTSVLAWFINTWNAVFFTNC